MKKILVLSSPLTPIKKKNPAGTAVVVSQDIHTLQKNGFEVELAGRNGDWISFEKRIGWLLAVFPNFFYLIIDLFFLVRVIPSCLRNGVILSHSFPLIGLLFPKKTVNFLHNEVEQLYCHKFDWAKKRYAQVWWVANSKYIRDSYVSQFSFLSQKNIQVVFPSVDISFFRPMPKYVSRHSKLHLLYVSAWVAEKGLDLLLQALEELDEIEKRKIQLSIVSNRNSWFIEKPKKKIATAFHIRIKQQIRILQKTISIKQYNGSEHTRMPQIYNQHDMLLFPSVWNEPFGLVVLEALACHLPVITSIKGGVPEIIAYCGKEKFVFSLKTVTVNSIKTALRKMIKKEILPAERLGHDSWIPPEMLLSTREKKLLQLISLHEKK